jgi:hypothetical protein
MPSALEIAQGRSAPLSSSLFYSVQTRAPLFSAFDFRTSATKNFKSLSLISLPDSAFVDYNEGFTSSNARFALREFQCSLIGGIIQAENITMREWNESHEGHDWFQIQTETKILADILNVERQLIKGTSNDAKGFPGAKEMTPFLSGNTFTMTDAPDDYDFERSVLNVAGTTANTATSVYSFAFGPMQCQGIIGNAGGSGEIFEIGEARQQFLAPDSSAPTKTSEHTVMQIHGYVGLSVSGHNQQIEGQTVPTQYSVRRAANITKDSGKTLTDSVMEKLATSHETGVMPSLFAMSARSGDQLAASRSHTAVHINLGGGGDARNSSGSVTPARPREWEGIPIVYPQPNCIGNTDAIES